MEKKKSIQESEEGIICVAAENESGDAFQYQTCYDIMKVNLDSNGNVRKSIKKSELEATVGLNRITEMDLLRMNE